MEACDTLTATGWPDLAGSSSMLRRQRPRPPTATSSSSPLRGTRPPRLHSENEKALAGQGGDQAWPTRSCVSAHGSNRWSRRVAVWQRTCKRRSPAVPGRRCVPPSAGQGARSPREPDRQRRAHLRRRQGRRPDHLSEIVRKIPGCRPLDAGELSNATAIEAFTAVLLQLNVRYRTRVGTQAHGNQATEPSAFRHADASLRHRPPGGGPLRAGAHRHDVHLRHHAVRRHSPRARGDVRHLRRPPAPADRPRPHRQVRAQRHRRRRSALRQSARAGCPLPRPGGGGGGPFRAATWWHSTSCPSYSTPRASSAIPDIRGFIGMVLDRGFAYQAGGSVYFDVSKFDALGRSAGTRPSKMLGISAERGDDTTIRTSATRSTSSLAA